MIRNYIKTAIRSILRNKTFTAINVFGLALSLAVCLIIIMIVSDQMKMDRHNLNADRIYRVNTQRLHSDDPVNMYATAPVPIGDELVGNYSGIEKKVSIRRGFGNGWVGIDEDLSIPLGGFFTDPEFFELFDYRLKYGNEATALVEPFSVVLTQKAATKLYGDNDPMGKLVDMGDIGIYKVTGVMEESDKKSHIVYEALASMSTTHALEKDTLISEANGNWDITSAGWTYIQLDANKALPDVINHLEEIDKKQYADKELVDYRFHLQNLLEINPGPLLGNQIGPGMPLIFVYFLSGLALLVMASACFNYTNLSIAQSIKRAKEVGVRKVAGAMKSQLFFQFLTESLIMALLSFAIALVIVIFAEPAFKQLTLVNLLQWQLTFDPLTLIVTFLFTMGIGIMAGLFPSLVMSSFQPIKVLKDVGNLKLFSKMGLRRTLLTAQLALSLFFIVSVALLYNQLDLMLHTDKGFSSDNIINVHLMKTDGERLKNRLEQESYIENVTLSSHIPTAGTTYDEYYRKNPEDDRILINYFSVDEQYMNVMDIDLIAGRNINYEAEKDSEIVVNEKAVAGLGYESPHSILGETLFKSDSSLCTIVGVIKDYHHTMLMEDIAPMALRNTERQNIAHVRINAESEEKAIEQIKRAWAEVNPEKQISYKALDTEIAEYYEMTFGDLAKLIGVFAFLALTVSSLGMLGMAIYSTQVRIREVSIRKVLGANEKQVIYILSKGFLKLMTIAVMIALPLAYLVNDLWLQNLAVRTDIGLGTVVFSTGILVMLTLITVGSQAVRVSLLNPANTLKNE